MVQTWHTHRIITGKTFINKNVDENMKNMKKMFIKSIRLTLASIIRQSECSSCSYCSRSLSCREARRRRGCCSSGGQRRRPLIHHCRIKVISFPLNLTVAVLYHCYWKWNNSHVRLLVGRSVGWLDDCLVCHSFLKEREVRLPCSYCSTFSCCYHYYY